MEGTCECTNLPAVFSLRESSGYLQHLPATARWQSAYRGTTRAIPGTLCALPEDWVRLVRCPSCGQHWQVDEMEIPGELQLAAKVNDPANWEGSNDETIRMAFLIQSRGGLGAQKCAWTGCPNRSLRDLAYCAPCAFQRGLRE
jgi:hypothetical protein